MSKKMSHDAGLSMLNRDHSSRNRGTGSSGGSMSQPAGGSTAVHDPGPKGKSPAVTNTDVRALKKLASGRPDTMKRSKTVS